MTKREALRQTHQEHTLIALGFTAVEAESLRRISMTLHRWHELECGDERGGVVRDEETGKTFWYSSMTGRKTPTPDRETGARKRLAAIVIARNERMRGPAADNESSCFVDVSAYIQGDPRGAALYILRPGDVPDGKDADSYYNRGICIY